MSKQHNKKLHMAFNILPVSDTCTWYGTEWEDDPTSKTGKILKPCGEPTVGAAIFCDDSHKEGCQYFSLCERHAAKSERFDY